MQLNGLYKISVAFIIVLIAVMAGAGYYLQVSMREKLTAHLKDDGLVIARTLARALPQTDLPRNLDGFCSAYRGDTHLRITIIEADGRVTGESHRSSAGMENHRDRPEILEALSNGSGSATRYSQTLKEDMSYVAVRTQDQNRVVRVAIPFSQLRQVESRIMLVASVFLYLLPFLAAVMLFFIASYLKKTRCTQA